MGLRLIWWPLAVMALDWLAVAKSWKRLEYFAKPAAMLALLAWLWLNSSATGHWAPALGAFAAGLVFSLAGDVMLMLPERFFLAGLVAFLLGHVAYSDGLKSGGLLLPIEAVLVAPMALIGGWLARRIGAALKATGRNRLRAPVVVYAAVISLMVVSALAMLFRPSVPTGTALLLALGAVLFFVSDAVLAWNRFVAPVRGGRLIVIVAYHLGQMTLIAGVVMLVKLAGFVS
jgi:uncharacterized membrane protein YhhN